MISSGSGKLSYDYRDIASSPYNEYWKEVRKLAVQQLLSNRQVNSIQPIEEEEGIIWCGFPRTVLNNDNFNKLIREALEILGSFSASNFFPYDWLTGLQGRREEVVRDLDAFYEQMINTHRQEKKEGSEDFVGMLLRLSKEEAVLGNDKLTRNHIKAILMNVLLGGIDTSAISMMWTMAELARNPRVMKKVQSEIRSHVKHKGSITFDSIDQLPYMKMVIKETWRLHPVVPLLLPREVISEFQINGYTIQPKTHLHRFMDSNIDAKGQNFELLTFGSGRRMCPGMYMGTSMVEFCLANMLYHFDWKLPEGMSVEDVDMEEAPGLT
ncbi:unnamed protein product, partial [Brassica napus]